MTEDGERDARIHLELHLRPEDADESMLEQCRLTAVVRHTEEAAEEEETQRMHGSPACVEPRQKGGKAG